MGHYYRIIFFILLITSLVKGREVYSQQKSNTKPLTLVFKLKSPSQIDKAKTRSAQEIVPELLRNIKAESVSKKFPKALAPASTVSRSSTKNKVDLSLIYELKYTTGQSFAQIKKALLSSGQVEYVEPLYEHVPLYIPNDPNADTTSTGQQEYLKSIKAYAAWDVTKGDTSVVIGILDTGVKLTHEDLQNKIKYNYKDPINGLDDDADGFIDNYQGWDFADNDADPTADTNGHGVSVSGFAAAQADNGKGIAGVGFNCKFLPLKVFTSGTGNFKGYEAIVYAADYGCKVINLSWGSEGTFSAYEQDIIDYAVLNKNAVVVAAAGNNNKDVDWYPAAYQNVLSVAGINQNDTYSNLTYHHSVDISAPGRNVYTTTSSSDNSYGRGSGSSYASPMVAGAAALVRSKFPDLTAVQVRERLRVTADDIYSLAVNAPYTEKLGKGRLNVYRALTETAPKSVLVIAWQIDKGEFLYPGETGDVSATYTNFLSPTSSLTVSISSSSPYVQILQGQASLGALASLVTVNQSTPFQIKITDNVPANTEVELRFGFTDGSYTDYQYVSLVLNPDYFNVNVNNLAASFLNRSNFGYEGLDFSVGKSVTYKNSDPLLAEGGLLIGASPTQVSDNIRNEKGVTDFDFYSVSNLRQKVGSTLADLEVNGIFEDSVSSIKHVGVHVEQTILAWKNEPNKDFIIAEYGITNHSTKILSEGYAGLFTDWDLINANKNVVHWNADLNMGYLYHVSDSSMWVGIKLLTAGSPGFYALENFSPTDGSINMGDGFTSEEKYKALSGGIQRTSAGGKSGRDVSFLLSSKLKALAPEEKDVIAFAFVAGDTRESLIKHAAAAQVKYSQVVQARLSTGIPPVDTISTSLVLYPNPSSGKFNVTLPSSWQQVSLRSNIVSTTGKTILHTTHAPSQALKFNLNGLSSGVYYLKLVSPDGNSVTRRFIIVPE